MQESYRNNKEIQLPVIIIIIIIIIITIVILIPTISSIMLLLLAALRDNADVVMMMTMMVVAVVVALDNELILQKRMGENKRILFLGDCPALHKPGGAERRKAPNPEITNRPESLRMKEPQPS